MRLAVVLAVSVHLHLTKSVRGTEWAYGPADGPSKWGDLDPAWAICKTGQAQSPIDIPFASIGLTSTAASDPAQRLASLFTPVAKGQTFSVAQTQGAPIFTCAMLGLCGTLTKGGRIYNLAQFHFHTSSEHTIDGRAFPMSVHMVHCTGDCVVGTDSFAVVTALFRAELHAPTAAKFRSSRLVAALWKSSLAVADGSSTPDMVDLSDLISQASGYFNFQGSLTTPPCTEGVDWLVQAEPQVVDQALIDAYTAHIGGAVPGNFRPPQALHGRTITYQLDAPSPSVVVGGGGANGAASEAETSGERSMREALISLVVIGVIGAAVLGVLLFAAGFGAAVAVNIHFNARTRRREWSKLARSSVTSMKEKGGDGMRDPLASSADGPPLQSRSRPTIAAVQKYKQRTPSSLEMGSVTGSIVGSASCVDVHAVHESISPLACATAEEL